MVSLKATNIRPRSSALLSSPTQVNIVLIAKHLTFCCPFLYRQHFKGFAGPAIIKIGGSQASSSSRLSRERPVLGTDLFLVPTSSGAGTDDKIDPPPRPPDLLLFAGVDVELSGLCSLCCCRRRRLLADVFSVLDPTSGFWSRLGLSEVDTVFSGVTEMEELKVCPEIEDEGFEELVTGAIRVSFLNTTVQ